MSWTSVQGGGAKRWGNTSVLTIYVGRMGMTACTMGEGGARDGTVATGVLTMAGGKFSTGMSLSRVRVRSG